MNFRELNPDYAAQVKKAAASAVEEITKICNSFGSRACGELGEKQAQNYLMGLLENCSDEVKREEFEVHPAAFMGFVPVAGTMLMASALLDGIGLLKNKKSAHIASAALAVTGLTTVLTEFGAYKKVLDPFYPKKTSGNVYAVRHAKGETKKRIIISGHTDSAPEWTYTYKLGSKGVVTVAGYAVAGLAGGIASSVASLINNRGKAAKVLATSQIAFLPAYAALYKFTNSKLHVPGASDDLSGCMIARSVMQYLADNDIRFENTEIVALLTGGEECGLRGAEAFFKAHPEMKNDGVETIFVGFDTIRDGEYMMIYNKDLNGIVRNDDETCGLVKAAALKCGRDVPLGSIPLGSTDAAAASRAGIKSASFVAMDPAPAQYYHTRLDTPDNLCDDTIEDVIEIALQTVFDFDER